MNIDLWKTIRQIERCLPENGAAEIAKLHKAYDLTLKLQSQLLGVIYDAEAYSGTARQKRLSYMHSKGNNENGVVTLVISEPLPSMKKLTEAVEEHWKEMIHAAISKAAQQESLPYFEKAMVEIEVITPPRRQ